MYQIDDMEYVSACQYLAKVEAMEKDRNDRFFRLGKYASPFYDHLYTNPCEERHDSPRPKKSNLF